MKTEVISQGKRIRFGMSRATILRNKQILKLISEDKRPKDISTELGINIFTLRWAIEWMRKNNGYKTLTALVADAVRGNMI